MLMLKLSHKRKEEETLIKTWIHINLILAATLFFLYVPMKVAKHISAITLKKMTAEK